MPEWKLPPENFTRIAHISDIQLGSKNALDCWKSLKSFLKEKVKPSLVVVTGDLVHTPDRKLYQQAKEELDDLGVNYLVCAGNHDCHFKGNFNRVLAFLKRSKSTKAVFYEIFLDKIAGDEKVTTMELGSVSKLKIGFVGADSSTSADFFARGYVKEETITKLEKTIREATSNGNPLDLVFLLVHHHLQSVRKLEEKHRQDIGDLANVTCLVNSGSFLERLAKANVDLVLHGHEHASHWGRYGSLEGKRGEILVLGAGSATGNDSVKGCSRDLASFNLLVISPGGSANVWVLRWEGGEWRIVEDVPLLDLKDARRRRLFRRSGNLEGELNSRIMKSVEFTRERNILVNWTFTNWCFPEATFSQTIKNSTGRPDTAHLDILNAAGKKHSLPLNVDRDTSKDHSWRLAGIVPKEFTKQPIRLEFGYRWRGGGLLTRDDINPIEKDTAPGRLRRDGYEYASVHCRGAIVESLELLLTIPSEYDPSAGVEVRVYDDKKDEPLDEEAAELQKSVIRLGPGMYSLHVPYPHEYWLYALAWKPPEMQVLPSETWYESVVAKGGELLNAFISSLSEDCLKQCRISLFAIRSDGSVIRTAHQEPKESGPKSDLLVLQGLPDRDQSALGQAIWGIPV